MKKASVDGNSPGFFLFLLLLLCSMVVAAPMKAQQQIIVNEVKIIGVSPLIEEEVRKSMTIKWGKVFVDQDLSRDVEKILGHLKKEGFFSARVESISIDTSASKLSVDIAIALFAGTRARIDSVFVVGDSLEPLSDMIETVQGEEYSPRALELLINRILKILEQRGYPLASIKIGEIAYRKEGADTFVSIPLLLNKGQLVHITNLQIEGNTRTRENVIVREARLKKDQLFSPNLPRDIKRRLEKTQLFASVSFPELYLRDNGTAGFSIKIKEGNVNHFDGILGYIPGTQFGQDGYVTGLIDLRLRNLFGTGRRFSTRWHRLDNWTQEIELKYFEPWIVSLPVNVETWFSQRKQDTTYVRRQFGLEVFMMFSHELSISGSFQRAEIFPSEGIQFAAGSSTWFLGISVHYDSRDDRVTPREGLVYYTSYDYGQKVKKAPLRSEGSLRGDRITLDLEYYLTPIQKQVIMVGIHARDYRSSDIELSDLFRFGGANTLRGYREAQFLGSRVAWSTLEHRWLMGGRSYLFGFVDAGYIYTPNVSSSSVPGQQLTRVGYGAGLRLDSGIGLIGVSLAFGQGDTFSTAKLHFRLINEF